MLVQLPSNMQNSDSAVFYSKIPTRPGPNLESIVILQWSSMDYRAGPMCSLFKVNKREK